MAEVLQAKPDGYTIGLLASDTMTMVPHWSKVPYGSAEDYTPIINLVSTPVVIAVKNRPLPGKRSRSFYICQGQPGQGESGRFWNGQCSPPRPANS